MKVFQIIVIIGLFTVSLLAEEKNSTECEIQNLKCIHTKLQKGEYIDLYRKNYLGKTSLQYALDENNLDLVKLIVTTDPSVVSITDKQGNAPIHRAVILNHKQILEFLLSYETDLNRLDRNGETILDLAIANGYSELADYLVGKGAESKRVNKSNTIVWVYGVYVLVSILITIWVARTLHKNGRIFLIDAFRDNELADSVNHLLVVGFYLINLGYITIALKIGLKPTDVVEAVEILSSKIGFVILLLGAMHFFNLYLFGRLRKRTLLKKELGIQENMAVVKPTS